MPVEPPVRVLHLIKSLGRGGAEMLLPESLRHSDRERFSFRYLYFLPWKSQMAGALEAQGAEVTCMTAKSNVAILLAARRIASEVRAWKADVLHCHLPIAGVVGRIAARLASVPVVYTEHNLLERYHPVTRRLNLLTWRWQDQVIAVSRDVEESIRRSAPGGVPIRTVLNGVDVDRFDRSRTDACEVRRRLEIGPDAPVVGTVAVFRTQKRLGDWLEAARAVLDRRPETRFVLVGDGPLAEELRKRATARGLDGAIHWAGLQEDVRPYLAAMDIYLMSSIFEGLPVALLEAMAMRCAVVSTDVGGIPEVVRDGSDGRLVAPGRPDLLAGAVLELLDDVRLRTTMGVSARRTVAERFSIQRMARELEASYLSLAGGKERLD